MEAEEMPSGDGKGGQHLYHLMDDEYMEAVRILLVEEVLMLVRDIAVLLANDQLRVRQPEPGVYVRPSMVTLEPLVHALESMDIPCTGLRTKEDMIEEYGEDVAEHAQAMAHKMVSLLREQGKMLEAERDAARDARKSMSTKDIMDALSGPAEIQEPDWDEGFGWPV